MRSYGVQEDYAGAIFAPIGLLADVGSPLGGYAADK